MALVIPSTQNPVGFFSPPAQLGPPSPLLADNIDMDTRDFASLFVGDDPIDAAVKLLLGTLRDSGAAVRDVGMPPLPKKMDEAHVQIIAADIQRALRPLIRNGDILFLGVDTDLVDESDQFTQVRAKYKNLRAMDSVERLVGLPRPIS